MPILATDIQYRLSGGAANADANTSLGGAKSSAAVPTQHFDDVSSAESAAGDIEYRCFYVHNAHASLTLLNARIFMAANTADSDTTIDIGVGTAAINATEQTVPNESTAPAGVTFSAPADYASGLALGNIPAGQHKAFWARRTVGASAGASNDTYTFQVTVDTAA